MLRFSSPNTALFYIIVWVLSMVLIRVPGVEAHPLIGPIVVLLWVFSPILAISSGIACIARGKKQIGTAGMIISITAIVLLPVYIAIRILLDSTGVLAFAVNIHM